jgi:oxygen-independent coproporphyrinogen-3 oxidase
LCGYCAFAKREYDAGRAEAWLAGLVSEIAHRSRETWTSRPAVDTVFLGGGTPSALTVSQWSRLGDILRAGFMILPDAEFTSEANPESFTPEIAAAMRGAGVNRVSLGVQSLDANELRMLDRIHGVAEVARAVRTARDAGFDNVNLDLMYGLPGQGVETFVASLEGVLALAPEHLSAYCLGLEPGTALAASVSSGALPRPDDDLAGAQYDLLVARAEAAGLALYEISNFARAGRECRHNLKYWRREDFMALGPSAHALLGNRRWANPATLESWIAAYAPGGRAPAPRVVPRAEARFEWIFLRLRLAEGFAEAAFEEAWGESIDRAFGTTPARLVAQGHLVHEEGRVRLNPDARFVSDAVFAEFAPDR